MKVIELPFAVKVPILACGADIKGAFALAKGRRAYLVDGFGDLGDADNFTRYEQAVAAWMQKLKIAPKIIAHDLHPGYFSSRFAKESTLYSLLSTRYSVQHHEAHIASAIVDRSIKGNIIGVAFDGTGYGTDGNIWGGEFFVGDARNLKRVAHFDYVPMPGADMAVREPWRMAASCLYKAFGDDLLKLRIGFIEKLDKENWAIVKAMIDKGINAPLTSSVGRLFDAVASLVLMKGKASFEAELPIALEKVAATPCFEAYDYDTADREGVIIIDPTKIIQGVVKDLVKSIDVPTISGKFHNTIADIILDVAVQMREKVKTKRIVLSGGVFQSRVLSATAADLLHKNDFKVFTHNRIPTNDTGIPIGQIAIAVSRIKT